MRFELLYTPTAKAEYERLEKDPSSARIWKAVRKTLALMEVNLRHPGLSAHKFHSLRGPNGEEVFEAFAQQKTPAAFRVFWYYGPSKGEITILAITPHP